MEGDGKEVYCCGLDIPPMDFEYLEQWNSWDKQGIDIFNLFKGVDELEVIDATANSALESSQEKGKNGVKHAISGQDTSDLSVCVPGRRRLKLRKMTTHDTDEKIVIEKSKTEVADGRRKPKNKNQAINKCPANPPSQENVEKDSKWKKLVADNMPRRQFSAELGCFKMSDLFKPGRKTKAGSDDATARNKAATEQQDSTEEASSSHEKLEKAKPKRQDSYSKPIKKRCSLLTDYSSLPKPIQGSYQKIEERATRKDRDDATAKQAASKPQVDSTEAACDEKLDKAKRKPQDSYNNAPKRKCTQLMDYGSLPKPTQGSYQKIEVFVTRNRDFLGVHSAPGQKTEDRSFM